MGFKGIVLMVCLWMAGLTCAYNASVPVNLSSAPADFVDEAFLSLDSAGLSSNLVDYLMFAFIVFLVAVVVFVVLKYGVGLMEALTEGLK